MAIGALVAPATVMSAQIIANLLIWPFPRLRLISRLVSKSDSFD